MAQRSDDVMMLGIVEVVIKTLYLPWLGRVLRPEWCCRGAGGKSLSAKSKSPNANWSK